MQKFIYRIIILGIIFVGSLFYFGRNIKEEKIDFDSTVEMGQSNFPVLRLKSGKQFLNLMHGYSGNIDANLIRDSITPIDNEQVLNVYISEMGTEVKKVNYEIREIAGNELIDSDTYNVLEEEDGFRTLKIKIKQDLVQDQEYSAKITIVTVTGKKINYYTRLKKLYDAKLKAKLDFVNDFHDSIFDKKKAKKISSYLEPNGQSNTSLAHVTINSSLDLVAFGGLKPVIVSEVIPTVKEIHPETASFELSYIISAETASGEELYTVKENYRVKWTESRMYLLRYDRKMETLFDINNLSLNKNELKIGITNNSDVDIITSADQNKICFVRERALWYYNLAERKVVLVFRFMENQSDYVRDSYDQHEVKILKMSEEGDIDFLVYGYMNRGDYEGRVAIVLYHYYAAEDRIEELVYIPMDVPYQILKEDLDEFSYLNKDAIFYFSLNNTVYSYNIVTKGKETLVSGLGSDGLMLCREGHYIAWQEETDPAKSKAIIVLDLETRNQRRIEAPAKNSIKLLGKIDTNLIYGFAKNSDIARNSDGTKIVPLYLVVIEDSQGRKLKQYKKKNYYTTAVEVHGNSVELKRVRKGSGGQGEYYAAKSDNILTKDIEEQQNFTIASRVTEKLFTEYYITFPLGYMIDKIPKVHETINTIITMDTSVHLKEESSDVKKYYIYSDGQLSSSSYSAGSAIAAADMEMGSVLDRTQQIIWQRGARPARNSINGIDEIYTSASIDSLTASLMMLFKYNHTNVTASAINSAKTSVEEIISEKLNAASINMTGASLEQILYYVGSNYPVIGMKDYKNGVLIIGYDELNVTYIDPHSRKTVKTSISNAEKMFEEAGNIFFGYVK